MPRLSGGGSYRRGGPHSAFAAAKRINSVIGAVHYDVLLALYQYSMTGKPPPSAFLLWEYMVNELGMEFYESAVDTVTPRIKELVEIKGWIDLIDGNQPRRGRHGTINDVQVFEINSSGIDIIEDVEDGDIRVTKHRKHRVNGVGEFPMKTSKPRVLVEGLSIMAPDLSPPKNGKQKESLITRYRPTCWDEVIGQDTAIDALLSGLDEHHAFILSGPPGTGKTTTARLAAAEVGVTDSNHLHEVDAARFNNAEAMDEVASMVDHNPFLNTGNHAFIIDECQQITQQGWTKLLKTIEESPRGWYWFLPTTDLSKVPVNIKDQRCAVIHFQLVGQNDILKLLDKVARKEGFKTPREVLALCAREAHGAPRRGLTNLSVCHQCRTREEALEVLDAGDSEELKSDYGYRIAQALRTPIAPDLQSLVKQAEDAKEHVESIRHVIRSYFKTVWYNAKKDPDARRYAVFVMDQFELPFVDYCSLIIAIETVIVGGTNGKRPN